MDIETKFEEIARKTGYTHQSCSCSQCANMCQTPCLGTPEDMLKIVEAGYVDRIALSAWWVGALAGVYPGGIDLFAPLQGENGWCTFYKDGLCELHELGLKPTEGKLAHHSYEGGIVDDEKWLTWLVAQEWLKDENYETIEKLIFEKFGV